MVFDEQPFDPRMTVELVGFGRRFQNFPELSYSAVDLTIHPDIPLPASRKSVQYAVTATWFQRNPYTLAYAQPPNHT
jgi:hypothetical protein